MNGAGGPPEGGHYVRIRLRTNPAEAPTPLGWIQALIEQDARALDLLAAERGEEVRDQLVHQLEVRRQRRRLAVGVVEDRLGEPLRVQRRSGTAVDEDEPAAEPEALAFNEAAFGNRAAPAERVEHLLLALLHLRLGPR